MDTCLPKLSLWAVSLCIFPNDGLILLCPDLLSLDIACWVLTEDEDCSVSGILQGPSLLLAIPGLGGGVGSGGWNPPKPKPEHTPLFRTCSDCVCQEGALPGTLLWQYENHGSAFSRAGPGESWGDGEHTWQHPQDLGFRNWVNGSTHPWDRECRFGVTCRFAGLVGHLSGDAP